VELSACPEGSISIPGESQVDVLDFAAARVEQEPADLFSGDFKDAVITFTLILGRSFARCPCHVPPIHSLSERAEEIERKSLTFHILHNNFVPVSGYVGLHDQGLHDGEG
jgi:hypothetical protein